MKLQTASDRNPRASRCATLWRARSTSAFVGLLVLLTLSGSANASCWATASARYGVHPSLLAAIAKVESGFNPNAVNDTHLARTGSVDLGLMQINSSWLPVLAKHGITRERLFEPCVSITVGAWILAGLFARYGVTWEAVGAYNAACVRLEPAECVSRRAGYARKVEAALRRLSGARPVQLTGSATGRIVHVSVDDQHVVGAGAAANDDRGHE